VAEDFEPLLTALRRVFPTCRLERVSEPKLVAIRQRHPDVPDHFLAFLRQVGWGSLCGTFMLYSGLVEPGEIFDPQTAAGLDGLLFFGDNFAGEVVGFDTRRGWRLVCFDNSYHAAPELVQGRSIGDFIALRLAEQEAEPLSRPPDLRH
jgi:hypothetical protein